VRPLIALGRLGRILSLISSGYLSDIYPKRNRADLVHREVQLSFFIRAPLTSRILPGVDHLCWHIAYVYRVLATVFLVDTRQNSRRLTQLPSLLLPRAVLNTSLSLCFQAQSGAGTELPKFGEHRGERDESSGIGPSARPYYLCVSAVVKSRYATEDFGFADVVLTSYIRN
jgi:hypothetical protein